MSHPRLAVCLVFALAVPISAQQPPAEPKPAEKVYEVPADGLVIDGKLSKDDPPLAGADGAPHRVLRVRLKKGERYVLYLTSSDFDALLVIRDAANKDLKFDNDSGGGTDARVSLVVPSDGDYRLLAAAVDRKPGSFQLKVRPGELTAEEKLADRAFELSREGIQLYQRGQAVATLAKLREALEIRRKLYPAQQYPQGHPDLAQGLTNLGSVLGALGQSEQALPYYRQAVEMYQKLYPAQRYPQGHPHLAISLNGLGVVLQELGRPDQGLPYLRQALEMRQKLYPAQQYPQGHPDLAVSLNGLGVVLQELGRPDQGLPYLRQALEMRQKFYPTQQYPQGNPYLAVSLLNLGSVLYVLGQSEQALPYVRRALEMNQKLYPTQEYPQGHPQLALSLKGMGDVLSSLGQSEQALPYVRRALEMNQKLYPTQEYPQGHPQLALSLKGMGDVLYSLGRSEQALPYYRQALEMRQKLFPTQQYPQGHPDLADSLNGLGIVLYGLGQWDQALLYLRQALEMHQKLFPAQQYPQGHPDLAQSLNGMGNVLDALGQYEQGLPYLRQALEMHQKLFPAQQYPQGHTQLANSLVTLGSALDGLGQYEQALSYVRQSLEMQQRLMRRELATASEEAAFDKINAQPLFRDAYLSITRFTRTPADEVVARLWPSRSIVTRLIEQRQANARAAGTALGDKLDRLRGLRRRLDQVLHDPKQKPEERDRLLTAIADERDTLEREVVAAMPTPPHWQELDTLGPADLAKTLPSGAVFLDVIRYRHIEVVDRKRKLTPRYVAFVLTKDRPVQRIELGEAGPIDREVQAWRRILEEYGNDRPETQQLKQLVWDKLAPYLPKGTKTLYLTADGDLARMPWAALPIGENRVLLEDYAVAQVPHGTFLLEQMKYPRKFTGADTVLALGGVRYNSSNWPELPGTATELKALDERQPITLSGTDATPARLLAELPKARVAHLATHGFFNAEELTKERERAAKALESCLLGDDTRKVAAKNPLGYVGLVLAKGEVLSGLSIPDVPLTNTPLVTLSACETGLGALTGGEGVQGLQRAFHLAGCPNVVASLWKVNDDATAALMTRFYYELLVNKRPPVEALREAQLLLYHRPDLVEDLLAERSSLRKKQAVTADAQAAAGTKHAATKLWAAFVLSGVGR